FDVDACAAREREIETEPALARQTEQMAGDCPQWTAVGNHHHWSLRVTLAQFVQPLQRPRGHFAGGLSARCAKAQRILCPSVDGHAKFAVRHEFPFAKMHFGQTRVEARAAELFCEQACAGE